MSLDREKFAGGVAVVTGAGAGIGAGLARRAGQLGMTVIVTDINEARAQQVVQDIKGAGGKAEALVVDVSRPEELDRLAETVFDRHGGVRLLVNNAGIETLGYTWEIPTDRWEATLDINIHGVIHGVRAFAPKILTKGDEAWIANLASVGSFGIMTTQTAYILTKHAIQSFNECLYLEMELANAPIHVSSIIPGMVKTAIFNADAGAGEPAAAARHRKTMHDMMAAYGMDLDEASKVILEQVAEGKFWVSTQPDMTESMIADRIAFLTAKEPPRLNETTRQLLGK